MKITRIPGKRELRKKRVAAYCRVSTELVNQEESFETQVRYYEGCIRGNPEWDFAGIYADEKSGTSAEHRDGFQSMVADAIGGKIDHILVKSISRFSRNVVDCQGYAERLKSHGVTIYFEKEGIDTSDPSSFMMFSLLAAIAQSESQSISENVKWGYRERFRRGEYNLGNNRILGYDTVEGVLTPNKDAWIIREIYECFTNGETLTGIADRLNRLGAKCLHSAKCFYPATIRHIIVNETYVGDKQLQKSAPQNFLTKKPDLTAEYKTYYLKDDHPAIVDRETWERAQAILEERREEMKRGIFRRGKHHTLYGKVFCRVCGAPFKRRTLANKSGYYKAWNCKERQKGKNGNGCRNTVWRETVLIDDICRSLGWDHFDGVKFSREVEEVKIGKEEVTVIRKHKKF